MFWKSGWDYSLVGVNGLTSLCPPSHAAHLTGRAAPFPSPAVEKTVVTRVCPHAQSTCANFGCRMEKRRGNFILISSSN